MSVNDSPLTREEQFLNVIAGNSGPLPDTPLTREEQFLNVIAGNSGPLPDVPLTREEQYLAKIAGQDVAIPDVPLTRKEMYLAEIAANSSSSSDVLKIVTQPQDFSGPSGTNAEFKVVATGVGLTYQWYYTNNQGASWSISTLTGNQTDTLTVGIKASRDGQSYRCVVTDANGDTVTSEAATLTMTS